MNIRERILARPDLTPLRDARDIDGLAAALSVGLTRPKETVIGDGTILEAFMAELGDDGLEAGNVFLDWFRNEPLFRHAVRMLDRGELRLDKPGTRSILSNLVELGKMPQAVFDYLVDLSTEPGMVTRDEVNEAMFNPDGTEK